MMIQATTSNHVYIYTEADVPSAMRLARAAAQEAGFSLVEICYLATVATELASNLWIHAGGGVFSVQLFTAESIIEMRTRDIGPGIENIALALKDGYSTAGGLGCGLPSIERLMDGLEIASQLGEGTQIRTWKINRHAAS
jgi:serine/threonine-protein kinase RsbT